MFDGALLAGRAVVAGPPVGAPGGDQLPAALSPEVVQVLQEMGLPPIAQALQNPQTPGASAALGLGRLVRLAVAWPGMFTRWIGFQPSPALLDQLATARGYRQGGSAFAGALGDARMLLAIALVQRAFNNQLAAGERQVQPGTSTLARFPAEFLNEATGESEGLPSVAALERKLENLDQVAYRSALQRAGLQTPPDRRTLERPLVGAGLIKYALHLWNLLPNAARINVMEIAGGATWPRPWNVYWPEPDSTVTELLLRVLTLVEQTRQDVEAFERSYSPNPMGFAPVTLGRIPGLEGYRIPAHLRSRFADPTGPGGEIHPQTLVSLALKAKIFASKNYEPGLRQIAARRGPDGLQWLIKGTPSLEVFNHAFDYRSRLIGGQSFARVVSRVPDYFDVLVVPGAPCEAALLNAIAPMLMGQLAPVQPRPIAPAPPPGEPLWPGAPPVLQPPPGGGPPGGGPPPGKGGPPWQPWNPTWVPTDGGPPELLKVPEGGGGGQLVPLPGEGGGGGQPQLQKVPQQGQLMNQPGQRAPSPGALKRDAQAAKREAQAQHQHAKMLEGESQKLKSQVVQKTDEAQKKMSEAQRAQQTGDTAQAAKKAAEAQKAHQAARAAQRTLEHVQTAAEKKRRLAAQKAREAAVKDQAAAATTDLINIRTQQQPISNVRVQQPISNVRVQQPQPRVNIRVQQPQQPLSNIRLTTQQLLTSNVQPQQPIANVRMAGQQPAVMTNVRVAQTTPSSVDNLKAIRQQTKQATTTRQTVTTTSPSGTTTFTVPGTATSKCGPNTRAVQTPFGVSCQPIVASPSIPSGGGGSASYGGKVATPSSRGPARGAVLMPYSGGSDVV